MFPTKIPYEYRLSLRIALAIEAEPYRCWRNAALAMHLLPALFSTWYYIEGWVVLLRAHRIDLIEHGWIALESQIVDPSLLLIERPEQPLCYFPGFRLFWEQLQQCLPGRTLPLVCHTQYGETGMAHCEYKDAYECTWQKALDLAQ